MPGSSYMFNVERILERYKRPDLVTHVCNPSTEEAQTEELPHIQSQFRLHNGNLCFFKNKCF